MSTFVVKLPDVGEGVAEAELVEWLVAVGDEITASTPLAEVMTDKATVEIVSPVAGTVGALHGTPGDTLAVGAPLVDVDQPDAAVPPGTPDDGPAQPAAVRTPVDADAPAQPPPGGTPGDADLTPDPPDATPATPSPGRAAPARSGRALAAPAVRARAATLGIDLGQVAGSGPDGRVTHADLDRRLLAGATERPAPAAADAPPHTEAVRGLRRRIAERLTASWTTIPHITYVDAIDATDLEVLRAELNRQHQARGVRLTLLPFLIRAMVIACAEQPTLNATFDADAGTLSTFDAVHVGIATQTDDGLIVPVVRNAQRRDVWNIAAEIARVSGAARDGSASRAELSGSTITITSLGALGGLVTTPLINAPEVCIVGVNKLETRPVWRHGRFEPRQMFNLSSSFDHRIVDGWDAATFVQRIKALLEVPALLFVEE